MQYILLWLHRHLPILTIHPMNISKQSLENARFQPLHFSVCIPTTCLLFSLSDDDASTILVFGILLITAGFLLASFESQRFSVSFIVFGYSKSTKAEEIVGSSLSSSAIGVIFAFVYWISAEKLLITLRKFNARRIRVIALMDVSHLLLFVYLSIL